MGRFSMENSSQRKVLTVVGIAVGVVLALLLILLAGFNKTPGAESTPGETIVSNGNELVVESVEEQEDIVLVNTTYVTVKYPYAFSDIVSVEAETFEDYAVLEFGAIINDTTYKAYTLFFNSEEGMPIGTLERNGETYVVTAQFHDASGIDEDSMITFNAVQETFNDVVNSLFENEGFTAAD